MPSSSEIRDRFRDFFAAREHHRAHSAPIVPQGDPTLIFVNAGMVPFKDVFTGQESPSYSRATSSQKCIRVSGKHNDLENVGVTARHHTFFEMLGNFSFGDYFKRGAIEAAWEFLTTVMGVPAERLCVTVFGGEGDLPADAEAEQLWGELAGLPAERIIRCDAKDNFWQMGDTGPCGPCSEIHYFFGEGQPDLSRFGDEPDEAGSGWVELWNLVFMQFERHADGRLEPLPAPCIDTGMGLERLACVLQGVVSNYDTDLLRPVVELAGELAGKPYGASQGPDDVSMRVIADHARATAFLIAEGVFPDREGRSYVLRRIMRRAIRHGHRLGIDRPFLHTCALRVVELMGAEYPELRERRALIEEITRQEEERFRATLKRGLDRLAAHAFEDDTPRQLPGAVAFELYDTYGFPLDLQQVIGREQGFSIDQPGFDAALEAARARSAGSKVGEAGSPAVYKQLSQELPEVAFLGYDTELASAPIVALLHEGQAVRSLAPGQAGEVITEQTPFYAESGGQMGDRGEIRAGDARFRVADTLRPRPGLVVHRGTLEGGVLRVEDTAELEVDHAARRATRQNHSATHLMHLALREVVGPHAMQKGSLVGPDRLRFDYSAAQPLSRAEIQAIEERVTAHIIRNAEVTTDVLPIDEAKSRGAIGIFEEKYGQTVRMLTISDSIELCGGTHVRRTGDIGAFKVLSDAGIAAGVRRIEAATGLRALQHSWSLEGELESAAELLRGSASEVAERTRRLLERNRALQEKIDALERKLVSGGSGDLSADARSFGDVTVLGARAPLSEAKAVRELADTLRDRLAPAVVVLGAVTGDGKVVLVCSVSKELNDRLRAGDLIGNVAAQVGGRGGGRPDFAQAGGNDPSKLDEALASIYARVEGILQADAPVR
ncbi:MAG: alanine--tRNA ligase [Myxococcales bacterium]|nr:alanine--tRNA ligase [Myxococcales bacterium]